MGSWSGCLAAGSSSMRPRQACKDRRCSRAGSGNFLRRPMIRSRSSLSLRVCMSASVLATRVCDGHHQSLGSGPHHTLTHSGCRDERSTGRPLRLYTDTTRPPWTSRAHLYTRSASGQKAALVSTHYSGQKKLLDAHSPPAWAAVCIKIFRHL